MKIADPAVASLVDAYRTCELATLAKDGTPVTWPASGIPRPDGTFLLTTSIAFPQKAVNIRRDARVALLFSDPTASGLNTPPQVLIRGTATCADVLHTAPDGDLGDFWRRILARQPASRGYLKPPARWLADWYFMRLRIEVCPEEVELAESTGAGRNRVTKSTVPGSEVLAAYPSVVLAARDASGAPVLHRTAVGDHSGGYALTLPAGTVAEPGPAGLLVHRHDENLANSHQAFVKGTLSRDGSTWVLAPASVSQPAGRGPRDTLATLRRCRATTARYLARRGWERPAIPWDAYRALIE